MALAGIIALDPKILLLDEPWSGLNINGQESVTNLIRKYKSKGKIIIISTQNTEEAAKIADQIILINKGKMIKSGKPHEILANRKLLIENGINPPIASAIYEKTIRKYIKNPTIPIKISELIRELNRLIKSLLSHSPE